MLQGWFVVVIALVYIGFLFLVASYGDRRGELAAGSASRLLIYPLSLAIYCTSWTFFGSVGLASRTGFDFITVYVGPILMIGLGWPLILRIGRLGEKPKITSHSRPAWRNPCSAMLRWSWHWRWRASRFCSARVTSTPPNIRMD